MFRDTYTDFSFDEIKSENFKVWITNNKDLQRSMSPNFSDKFNSPTYGQTRFYEGTTIDKQDFKLSCAAINITLNEWRAITEWLSPLKSGKLRFDWNDKYYYMVKISKSITGSMFIKSKIDSVMGDLYTITFTVEFTTINDWAALGPYCWQENYELVTVDENSTTKVRNVNPSIYNNSYYIPQFIERIDGDNSKEYATDYYISSINPDDKMTISIHNNNIYYYDTYESAEGGGEDGLLWKISGDKVKVDGTKQYKHSFNKNNLIVCNPSSLNMYLEFSSNGNTTISKDGIDYYKFSYLEDKIDQWVPLTIINTKNGTVTSNGTPIQSIFANGVNVYMKEENNNFTNKSGLIISSGRPELMKVIVKKYEVSNTSNDDSICTLKCLLNAKPIYSREHNCIVHLFDEDFMNFVDEYDKGQYSNNNKTYGLNLENIGHKIVDTPVIKYSQENGYWYLTLIFKNQKDFNGMDSIELNFSNYENRYLYISICDYESLKVDVVTPKTSKKDFKSSWSVSGQTREVI